MFMNKKLMAFWNKIKSRFSTWSRKHKQAALMERIAKAISDDNAGEPKFESEAQWGVVPSQLANFVMRHGNHCVERGVYFRQDGSPLVYPMKFKHNDGSVDIIKILSRDEIGKLASEDAHSKQTKAEEAAFETYRKNGGYKSKDEFIRSLTCKKPVDDDDEGGYGPGMFGGLGDR